MLTDLRKLFCSVLALSLAFTPVARAQQSSTPSAPIPPQILSAHTVFISNGGSDSGYSKLYSNMQRWGRYQLVDSPAQADLIFEIHFDSTLIDAGGPHSAPTYNSQLFLRILDAKTNALLWTITSNVKPAVRKKTSSRYFDRAVAILVYQARQLNGEKLTAAQQKDIADNNRFPTSTKILIGVIAGAAVVTAVIAVHEATSRKLPTLPSQPPPCITPVFCPA
jgi:hypothetical protein